MQVDSSDKIRNIAVAGHSDTGKTTLVSSLLYAGGVVNRLNRVEDGNTVTDFDPEEIERGISIGQAVCHAPWRQHKINLLDCPGYGIFFDETRGAMLAADSAMICINATAGIEVTAEKAWDFVEHLKLPTMITLTKMDQPRAKGKSNLEQIRNTFGREAILVQLPIGKADEMSGVIDLVVEKAYTFTKDGNGKGQPIDIPDEMKDEVESFRNQLVEAVAETDDSLIEEFFEVGTLPTEDLIKGLRQAIRTRKIFPVTLVAAGHGIGVSTLMDAIVDYMPSPADRSIFPGFDFGGEAVDIASETDSPMSTLIFKTLSDPFTGKISMLRVVSGKLTSDTVVWNTQNEDTEKVGHLMAMQGKQGEALEELITGDIGGVAKLKHAKTGHTLSTKKQPIQLAWMEAVEPAISFAIEPKSKGDDEKIGEALARLLEEDPSLLARRDQETGEFLLAGAGQLHVEIAVARLKKRFHVDVILHPPKIPYRETIRKKAPGHGRHKKQSGGRGQFADCRIMMEPTADGEFEFIDEIFGGSIPQGYRPAVDKGIQAAAQRGFLAGFPVVGFKVRLQDGQYHDVDSSEMAFKIAGSLAFKDAMSKAGATLLEPVMKVEISTSEEFMGDIMSDLSQRRGRPQGMDTKNGTQVVKATVPMAEMLDYAPALTSMTQGRASFHIEFSHYDQVPKQLQEKIIEAAQKAKEEEHH